ncbi:MAG: chromosome segregation protein SMC, partial [Thioalkalivibrio sp.]|nr:chromosome segregation protein SMC [Thioalkalivibrio sp.]
QAAQAQYYDVSATVSRLEQSIRHAEEELQREAREQTQLDARIRDSEQALLDAQRRVESAETAISTHELEYEAAAEALEQAERSAETAEQQLHAAREARSSWHQAMAEPQQAAQLARTRMDHADQLLQRARQRRERLLEEQGRLPQEDGGQALGLAEDELAAAGRSHDALQQRREMVREDLAAQRRDLQAEQDAAHALERKAREIAGQLSSLKILPGMDKDEDRVRFEQWAREQGIDPSQRVAAQIDVDPGWEAAVEVVLGQWFEAVLMSLSEMPASLPGAAFRARKPFR